MSVSRQRHLASLRKNVKEKIENIVEQQTILTTILDEYVSDTKMHADYLLGIMDYGLFMHKYMDVMKSLDMCFNTFVLLNAEAENFIDETLRPEIPAVSGAETISKEYVDDDEVVPRPPRGTIVSKPPGETISKPLGETSVSKPPGETILSKPPRETIASKPPGETIISKPPRETIASKPPRETIISKVQEETILSNPPVETIASKSGETITSRPPRETNLSDTNFISCNKTEPVDANINHNLIENCVKPAAEKQVLESLNRQEVTSVESNTAAHWNEEDIVQEATAVEHFSIDEREKSIISQRPRINTEAAKRFLSGIINQAQKHDHIDTQEKKQDNRSSRATDEKKSKEERKEVPKEQLSVPDKKSVNKTEQPKRDNRSSRAADEKTSKEERKEVPKEQLSVPDKKSVNKTEQPKKDTVSGYGLGPHLRRASLSMERPTTVVVTEPSSPWNFYVQEIMSGLDKLMEQIFSYMLKKGEDRGKIEQPLEGMNCLAKYSLDNIYYRAKVTKLYNMDSVSGDTAADVLFVDYGNQERRSTAFLRELPEKFASLPAQAVSCALAKVSPTNKYGIWTEDDITTFSQFVASHQFSCINVCPSEDADFPQLVELYLYSPVPTIRDGKFFVQNAPTRISINSYLLNQGRARVISLEDEVEALKKSGKFFEKLIEMSASKISSSSSKEDLKLKTTKSTTSVAEKQKKSRPEGETNVRIPRPVKLPRPHPIQNSQKLRTSKTVKPQYLTSINSNLNVDFSKFKMNLGENVDDTKLNDSKSSNLDSSSVKSETTGISTDSLRQQEDSLDVNVQTEVADTAEEQMDQNLDSMKATDLTEDKHQSDKEEKISNVECDITENNSVKVSELKQDAQESELNEQSKEEVGGDGDGSTAPVTCSKELSAPERQHSIEDNELSRSSANVSPLTVKNFLSDLPEIDIKILNNLKQDDQLSNISSNLSSESGIVANPTEGVFPENPSEGRTIDLRSKAFNVMLSHVRSPSHFYVHIVCRSIGKTLDNMMKNLNREFESLSKKGRSKLSKSYTPKVNDLCCAQFSGDNFFYRAVVTAIGPPEEVPKQEPQGQAEATVGRVHVFYLDFGDREWLPKRKVFPLSKEYKDTPPLALSCSLAHVRPAKTSHQEGNQTDSDKEWPESVTDAFVSMTGFDKVLQMVVVSGKLSINMESSPGCGLFDNAPIKVFLIQCSEDEEVCINLDLIHLGHATLVTDGPSSPDPLSSQSGVSETEMLADWDPMAEDYLSMRNSYNIDIDDPGIATVGYHAQDEKRICKYFINNSCWRGDRCPYRHVQVTSGVTMDQEPVYAGLEEYHMETLLPEVNCCVAVEIVTILNPGHFYVILPLGKKPLDVLHKQSKEDDSTENEETLEELVFSMQLFYSKKMFSDKTLVHYAEGEIIAAKFSQDGHWYRAKVLSTDDHRIQVFFVDFGNREWVIDRNVRNMDPQFLHLPFQAIECFLTGIEPVDNSEQYSLQSKKYFLQLVDGKLLVAYVKARSWSGCLWVDLYDTSGPDDVNICHSVISKGFAQKPLNQSDTGSSMSSRSASEGSLVLLPG